jgi:hypothetical protein
MAAQPLMDDNDPMLSDHDLQAVDAREDLRP